MFPDCFVTHVSGLYRTIPNVRWMAHTQRRLTSHVFPISLQQVLHGSSCEELKE